MIEFLDDPQVAQAMIVQVSREQADQRVDVTRRRQYLLHCPPLRPTGRSAVHAAVT